MTSCPLLSFFALCFVSHIRRVRLKIYIPDARKMQELTVRQLSQQAHVDSLFPEGFWRFVIDEPQICTNFYDRMLASTNNLLG